MVWRSMIEILTTMLVTSYFERKKKWKLKFKKKKVKIWELKYFISTRIEAITLSLKEFFFIFFIFFPPNVGV